MTKEQIQESINTIIALNEDLDYRIDVRAVIYDNHGIESAVNIMIYYTAGYDHKLEKEAIIKYCEVAVNPNDWYNKGIRGMSKVIDELIGVFYDEEINDIDDKKFYREEMKFEESRGN